MVVHIRKGDAPLVLGMPHVGTMLPPEVTVALNDLGRSVPDTDWWLDRLYRFADSFAPTVVTAQLSRYVIDLNRNPSGQSLYPGQSTTELCPTTTFDGESIYRPGCEPDGEEITRRHGCYFVPYHQALWEAVAATRARHGYAILYDCHSIRSVIPRLFPGKLPTLNIGTHSGQSCAPEVAAAAVGAAARSGFSFAENGRFKGGWITRHYGRPSEDVHALQMEITQSAYMLESPPWTFDENGADRLAQTLAEVLSAMLAAAAKLYEHRP